MGRPAERFYQEALMRPALIHDICAYRHGSGYECKGCGPWEDSSHGPMQRGCYALATELIAKVLEDSACRKIGGDIFRAPGNASTPKDTGDGG